MPIKCQIWNQTPELLAAAKQRQLLGEKVSINMGEVDNAFAKMHDEVDPVFLGFELETGFVTTEAGAALRKEYANDPKFGPLFNFRADGSDTEIVSIPASLAYHKSYMEEFFDRSQKVLADHPGHNGLHVHIDKESFTPLTLQKFALFINNVENKDFMVKVAGRDFYTGTNYARPMDNTARLIIKRSKRDNKSIGVTVQYNEGTTIKHNGKDVKIDKSHLFLQGALAKYSAVNCSKINTVEVRIFVTSVKRELFFMRLEFCEALVQFTRTHPYREMYPANFKQFVVDSKNQWPYLESWLNTQKV